MWILLFGAIATFVCRLMYKSSTQASRQKINEFFETMYRPIDYEKEVGSSIVDYAQYFLLAKSVLVVGALVLLILFVPNDPFGRLCILSVSLSIMLTGAFLYVGGLRARKRVEASMVVCEPQTQNQAVFEAQEVAVAEQAD